MTRWRQFEEDIGQLVEFFGYGGQVTKATGDQGVDVLARRGDRVIAIQCKLHSSAPVGSTAIQSLLASRVIHGATDFICFTTGKFTKQARELAGATGTVLIDGKGLLAVCTEHKLTLRPRCFARFGDMSISIESDLIVGRAEDCGLQIHNAYVSGTHAKFERFGLCLYVTDLGSSNGTFLNGDRVPPERRCVVTYGDKVRFAHIECEIFMDE